MSDDSDITDKEWSAGYDQARSDIAAGRQIIEGMVCIHRAQLEALMALQTAAQNAWELLRYQPRELPSESEVAAKLLEHSLAALEAALSTKDRPNCQDLKQRIRELEAIRDAQADELKEVDQLDCSKRITELEAEQLKMGALRHQLEICENERAKYRAERDAIRVKTIEEIILMMVKAKTWDAFEIELRALAEPESDK